LEAIDQAIMLGYLMTTREETGLPPDGPGDGLVQLRLLRGLVALAHSGERVETLFHRVDALLRPLVPAEHCALLTTTRNRGEFIVAGARGPVFNQSGAIVEGIAEPLHAAEADPATEPVIRYRLESTPADPLVAPLLRVGLAEGAHAILRGTGGVLGLLHLARFDGHPFTDDEAETIATVGLVLSQALESQRRADQVQAAAMQRQAAARLAVLLNSVEPFDSMRPGLLATIRAALDFDFLEVAARIGSRGDFQILLSAVGGQETEVGRSYATTADIEAIRSSGRNSARYRPEQVPAADARRFSDRGLKQMITAVGQGEEDAFVLLSLGRTTGTPFLPEEAEFTELVAALVAQVLIREQRLGVLQAALARQELVGELSLLLGASDAIDRMLERVLELIGKAIPSDYIQVTERLPDGVYVTMLSTTRRRGTPTEITDQDVANILATGSRAIQFRASHIGGSAGARNLAAAGLDRSLNGVMQHEGETLGLLGVSRANAIPFDADEVRFVEVVAGLLGQAVANRRRVTQIEQQRALYELVFNTLSEAVIVVNTRMEAVIANRLGREIVDAINEASPEATVEGIAAQLPAEAAAAFRTASDREGEARRGRSQLVLHGAERWFDYEFIPLQHPELRLLVVAADVTGEVTHQAERERHAEQLQQSARLAALGELIGGVAHELNNPLTAILGFAEMLAIAPDTGAHAEEITVIQKEALRARDVVRDLLFIARPGAVEQGEVLLRDVVGHIQRLRRSAWSRQGIAVTVDMDHATGPVPGNEHQLTQVLLNLVTNAEQALQGRETPAITIRATATAGMAIVEITDNGKGMDAATRARIFEPFFTGRPGVGTGLGLSLSHSMVAAHGGRIDVESRPGRGTTFRITLPLRQAEQTDGSPPAAATTRRLRVLIIDDEPSLRKVAGRLFAQLGHDSDAAATAAEAAGLARTHAYDLVLCDYRLANETADAVIAALEDVAPNLVARTVLATGATTDAGVAALTERYTMELVAKPYGLDDLARVLADVVDA
jgi:signal transduction histidine kinase